MARFLEESNKLHMVKHCFTLTKTYISAFKLLHKMQIVP